MNEQGQLAWIDAHVARTTQVWRHSAALQPRPGPRYSVRDHQSRERAYDAALHAVEHEADATPPTASGRAATQRRLLATFARFAANALDLDARTTGLLTDLFLPAGIQFARSARSFDPAISREDTIQACRNAWTACGLQPLLGAAASVTPSILAYSLLYPYSDNYLDAAGVSTADKLAFSRRFRERLRGAILPSLNLRESCVWSLVAMIESQYPRAQFPLVYDCLLAIHHAQEDSLAQLNRDTLLADGDLLQLSFAKGGASVLADACLARGSMTPDEARFAFEWGALLQLGDDLQDVRGDLLRDSSTLFTRAIAQGLPLDCLVTQLLVFCDQVAARMNRLAHGPQRLKDLLRISWRSLILSAIAEAHQFFTPAFVSECEQLSPFRFDFLRERRTRLATRQGLYSTLFDLFVDSPGPAAVPSSPRITSAAPCLESVI